uniref:Oxidoreductase n=2 Tax=Bursaphelenchus xylophilus TaxID=6326 RepID=A0A1I7SJ96_BURXY
MEKLVHFRFRGLLRVQGLTEVVIHFTHRLFVVYGDVGIFVLVDAYSWYIADSQGVLGKPLREWVSAV